MTNITEPTFEGTPDDEVLLVDAYEEEPEADTEAKNTLKSKLLDFKDNVKENIDNALNKKGLGDKIDKAKEKVDGLKDKLKSVEEKRDALKAKVDAVKSKIETVKGKVEKVKAKVEQVKEYKDRVQAAIKGDRSAILGIAGDIEGRLGINLTGDGDPAGILNRGFEVVDQVMFYKDGVQRFLSGDPKDIGNILGFLGEMSDTKIGEFLDLGVYVSFASELVNEIQEWHGAFDFLDDIFRAYKNPDGSYSYGYSDDYRFEVGRQASSSLTGNNDLEFILRLIEHAGANALLSENPDFPIQLLSNYTFPPELIPGEEIQGSKTHASELALLVKILDILKPDWFKYKRSGINVWNLYFINHASEDATELFLSDSEYRDAMLVAPSYDYTSFHNLTRELYPEIPLEG